MEELQREQDATDNNNMRTIWKEVARSQVFADTVYIGTYTVTPTNDLLTYMPYKDLTPDPVLEEREKVKVDKQYI